MADEHRVEKGNYLRRRNQLHSDISRLEQEIAALLAEKNVLEQG